MIGVQKLCFHVPQLMGKIHMDFMGIDETFCLLPEGLLFLPAVFPDVHDLRGAVDAEAVLEHRDEKLSQRIGARREKRLLPRLNGVEEQERVCRIKFFAHKADQIGNQLMALCTVNPVDGLVAWVRDFFRILGQLDFRDEFSGFPVLDGGQLIDASEGRRVLGGNQVCADAPGVDGCALML